MPTIPGMMLSEYSPGGYIRGPEILVTVYHHGDHASLTYHCDGNGYKCDRIIAKAQVTALGRRILRHLNNLSTDGEDVD